MFSGRNCRKGVYIFHGDAQHIPREERMDSIGFRREKELRKP
jgi:hypothetical protein